METSRHKWTLQYLWQMFNFFKPFHITNDGQMIKLSTAYRHLVPIAMSCHKEHTCMPLIHTMPLTVQCLRSMSKFLQMLVKSHDQGYIIKILDTVGIVLLQVTRDKYLSRCYFFTYRSGAKDNVTWKKKCRRHRIFFYKNHTYGAIVRARRTDRIFDKVIIISKNTHTHRDGVPIIRPKAYSRFFFHQSVYDYVFFLILNNKIMYKL